MYLSIEEYLAKRKRKDSMNEFDMEQRVRNMGLCISYVVEYFEKYLDPMKLNAEQAIRQKKAEKFQKQFAVYTPDVARWLLAIYNEYGKRLDQTVQQYLKMDPTYHLRHNPEDYRLLAKDFLAEYLKKLPFLQSEEDNVKNLMANIARVHNSHCWRTFGDYHALGPDIMKWLTDTYKQYNVNLIAFAESFAHEFHNETYECKYNREYDRVDTIREYDYKANDENLFEIDTLYDEVKDLPFMQNRKQELEILLMYTWLFFTSGEKSYWITYLSKNERRRQLIGCANSHRLILVQYGKHPCLQELPYRAKMLEAHFDIDPLTEAGRYILNTEFSYGRRKFSSAALKACDPILLTHQSKIPVLWVNKNWSIAFAHFIIESIRQAAEPEIIEVYSPFRSTVSTLDQFIELYLLFEDELSKKLANPKIAIMNRYGAAQRDITFLISSIDDMEKLGDIIAKKKLNLRIGIDLTQLLAAQAKRDWFSRNRDLQKWFGQMKEFRDYILCLHVLGKMLSGGRTTLSAGDLACYFNQDEKQKEVFLQALAYVFDDNLARYIVPEVSTDRHTITLIKDLNSAGFQFE